MTNQLHTCARCGCQVPEPELHIFGGQALCLRCLEEDTVLCRECGERIWREDNAGTEDVPLCQNCYDERYTSCCDCGTLLHIANANYEDSDEDEDHPYCSSCYQRHFRNASIHDYYYKPRPVFYGEGPRFFGVELEIDGAGEDREHAQTLLSIANGERMYIKHDGSLDDGLELVTHPMSLAEHLHRFPWETLCEKAVALGYLSHRATTCGLHIHVSRRAFGETERQQDAAIARILYFFEKHWEELLKFSRRTQRQLERWAARYGYKEQPMEILDYAKKGYHGGRYTCVNLQNSDTVEFRMFRGTLKDNTLLATLELVDRICDVAINLSDEELRSLAWTTFVSGMTEDCCPELVRYLKERRLYVNEPVESEVEAYLRLSREDGDKAESDSIANQRNLLEQYIEAHPELHLVDFYQDDGYTGTNFDRPAFRKLEADIDAGRVNCVLVKDLSRFGRDYIEMGRYLERVFPTQGVRFIAVNDHVDSRQGRYDMLLPMKNIFNTQYARDISDKVRSAIHTKQQRGEFIGAFPSYGYQKDPADRNHLVIDPTAAQVVKRIFDLFEQGWGKIKIAKQLNGEGIPSPSEYKRLLGERYHNGRKIDQTTYWTYATIHRILQNQMYAGSMEQGRNYRPIMHGKAVQLDRSDWTVIPGTHEAIIRPDQWERVQALLRRRTRQLSFEQNQSPFAGFLRCGDCGRAMVKTKQAGGIYYSCGSYKRYGPTVCTKHSISHTVLEQIVLEDLNQIIASVQDLHLLAEEVETASPQGHRAERERLEGGLDRLYRLKKSAYEDYRDGLLRQEDFRRYQADYERQERELSAQLKLLEELQEKDLLLHPWVQTLLQCGKLTSLDRVTVAETIKQILIFEDGRIEITYTFSNELGLLKG